VDLDGGIGLAGHRGPGLRRFSHEAMNTVFEVHVAGADARYAAEAAQAAFALVDRLEGELSRFRHNSDITRINHLSAGERTRVGEAAFECLVIARHLHDLTGGAFDIAIGTGLPALELDAESYEVHATADGVRVDLGGIGKGYAVDLVAELLEEWGLERAFVHGGFSSAVALDPPEGADGWPLTLSDPRQAAHVFTRLSLRQTALSASGVRKGEHIRDPRTGEPVRGRLAAWAALPRPQRPPGAAAGPAAASAEAGPRLAPGAVADALTTAFMLLPAEEIEALCQRSPGLQAWILADGGSGSADLKHLTGPALDPAGSDSE
jgi:thiamine biosynthesis lipoprotein